MDTLALINSAINFVLYCSMSQQFRKSFSNIFLLNKLPKWMPVAQKGIEENENITKVTHV